jgi:hypothetical protein
MSPSGIVHKPGRRNDRAGISAALLLLFAAACAAPSDVADFAVNEELFQPIEYRTKLLGDRTAFVAPLADRRDAARLPSAEGAFPIVYDPDNRWLRPVAEMTDDVIRREVSCSGLFAKLVDRPADADVILQPALVAFHTGHMERVYGASAIGEVAIQIRAHGPVQADGNRQLLFDEVFVERQVTPPALRTVSRHFLAAASARATMGKLLAGIDQANLGRSGMPAAPMPGDGR